MGLGRERHAWFQGNLVPERMRGIKEAVWSLRFGIEGSDPVSLTPQAEEEFNRAQSVFEDLNQELLEELPVLYHR